MQNVITRRSIFRLLRPQNSLTGQCRSLSSFLARFRFRFAVYDSVMEFGFNYTYVVPQRRATTGHWVNEMMPS